VVFGTDTRLSDTRTPTDNSVTSAKIVDGTIVNADISASAAISASKLSGVPAGNATMQRIANAAYISEDGLTLGALVSNYASTPDDARLDITGDIELVARVTPSSWSGLYTLIAKRPAGGTNQSYWWILNGSGAMSFAWSTDGTTANSINALGTTTLPTSSATLWLKVTLAVNSSSNRVVTFYYAADQETEPSSWTTLQTLTTAGATSIFASTAIVEFGAQQTGASTLLSGTIKQAIIRNGIGGTTVLNADFAAAQIDALSFPESSNSATVSVTTTRYSLGLPGVQIVDVTGSFTTAANTVYYSPFEVTAPIVVDYASVDVTTAPASTASVRMGIYAADTNQQPTGAPLMDTGAITVATGSAAVYSKQTTAVTLQPGIYLQALNTSVAMGVRNFGGPRNSFPMTMGTTVNVNTTATQTFGAFPSPGTAWTARGGVAAASRNPILFRWRAAS